MLDPIDESRRPEQTQSTSSSQKNTQHLIESYEMVHVRMRHEHVIDAQDFTRGEPAHIPNVEEYRPLAKEEFDLDPRITEGIIQQLGMENGFHVRLWFRGMRHNSTCRYPKLSP